VIADSYLIFAGRRWLVIDVDDQKRVIQLRPAPAGKVPPFGGHAGRVHDNVRKEMRRVYSSDDEPTWLNATALELLEEGRQCFRDFGLSECSIVPAGRETYWFTWRGDRCNDTWLAYFMSRKLRANNNGAFLTLEATREDVEQAVAAAHVDPRPEPEILARMIENTFLEKFDWTLSEELRCVNYASSALDAAAFQ
jgi:ATP-dependent Lhr-like helicase